MKILLLGSGGREHALAWKICKSSQLEKLYVAPGNAGTSEIAENIAIDINDFEAVGNFCIQKMINVLVVGPEQPLVNGIHDYFENNSRLKSVTVIGPKKEGAK
ncbi:MAG: phosphoribosylamine--glycine ligase N-terminal domain-containing protein, partial [Flavobacteriales bacterium]